MIRIIGLEKSFKEFDRDKIQKFLFPSEFFRRQSKINLSYYEVLPEELKPFFDIENVPEKSLIDSIISKLLDQFQKFFNFHSEEFVLTYNEHSSNHSGHSFHLILCDCKVQMKHLKDFISFASENESLIRNYVDDNVYSKNRLFRTVGSYGITKNDEKDLNSVHRIENFNLTSADVLDRLTGINIFNPNSSSDASSSDASSSDASSSDSDDERSLEDNSDSETNQSSGDDEKISGSESVSDDDERSSEDSGSENERSSEKNSERENEKDLIAKYASIISFTDGIKNEVVPVVPVNHRKKRVKIITKLFSVNTIEDRLKNIEDILTVPKSKEIHPKDSDLFDRIVALLEFNVNDSAKEKLNELKTFYLEKNSFDGFRLGQNQINHLLKIIEESVVKTL